jgi:hypothetical protein
MPAEPINIFAPKTDPAAVIATLRKITSKVEVSESGGTWRNAVVTAGWPWSRKTLTITHDPAYCSEPNWSVQMEGLRGYLARFPDCLARSCAIQMTRQFAFALATTFEPDRGAQDARVAMLGEVALAIGGIFFSPSGLRDPWGRVLLSPDLREIDPSAGWPPWALSSHQ